MSIAAAMNSAPTALADDRAAGLYAERLHAGHVRVDRLFAALLPIQWLAAVAFAIWLPPYTWAGEDASIHVHVWSSVALGGLIVALPLCLIQWHPGRAETRHCVAVAQMLVGALLIHVSGGRIETHFHIFGSLAFLALYRDWRVLILASAVAAMDHLARGVFWPRSVYGIAMASPWRWLEHTAWVIFEDVVLIRGVRQSLAELHDLAARQAEAETARASVDRVVEERTAALGRANEALLVEVVERRRAEAELRERHRFVESLADANPSIIYLLDPRAERQVWVNGRITSVLGYSQEFFHERSHDELVGRLIEPGDAARAGIDDFARRLDMLGDGVREYECRVRHADGSWRWLCYRETALRRDADGRVLQALGTAEDVTERKHAEQALRVAYDEMEERVRDRTDELRTANAALSAEVADRRAAERALRHSEAQFRTLSEAIPQLLWVTDAEGRNEYVNARWYEYFGLTPGEASLHEWIDRLHPDERDAVLEGWCRAAQEDDRFQREFRMRNADGEYRWFLVLGMPQRDEGGRVIRWIGTSTDIEDQKRAEEALRRDHDELEERVRVRTAELERANLALVGEVADRLRAEEAIRESEERFRLMADSAPVVICVTDSQFRCTFVNRTGAELCGVPAEELCLDGWQRFMHPEDLGRYLDERRSVVPGGPPVQLELRLRRADGQWRWMAFTSVRRFLPDGTFVGSVSTAADITERKEAEEALLKAKEAAEAASRAKSEFLANMSHEIRTPMNGIIGMTELALDTELTSRQREYLNLVRGSADSLLAVINDILDFSKIEAGKLELDPSPFALRDAISETLQTLALRAHAKGLELACRIAPDVPDRVVGDVGRLRQVIVNLVGNAIKFTEHGEVIVTVVREDAFEAQAGGESVLRFTVADTGIGIPASKLEAIFEPFEQADRSTTRRYGGTGLGLAISAKLVSMMCGRIWADSRPGVGSTFGFTVALGVRAGDRREGGRADADFPRLEGLPILIVDDNATNRLILAEVLSSWGARPSAVAGAREALAALRAAAAAGHPFAAALVDGMMPEVDGLGLARLIRDERSISDLPVLLLTSAGGPEDPELGRALRIAACLTKPVRQSDLFEALMPWGASAGVGAESSAGGTPAAPTGPALSILLAEDHPVNQKVAVRMLEGLGHATVVAHDGAQALRALDSGRFDLILMDLQMPEMDGFEAVRAIRAAEAGTGRHLPILALTAHAMQGDRQRCLDAGFDGYLAKPIRRADLEEALATLGTPAAGRPAGPSGPQAPAEAGRLLAALEAACDGDAAFAREIAVTFLDSAPRCLDGIREAIDAEDRERLAAEAHGLNGTSRTIGAVELADACKALECLARDADLRGAEAIASRVDAAWGRVRDALEPLVEAEALL
jgi:PAS domain S-box-containing protein